MGVTLYEKQGTILVFLCSTLILLVCLEWDDLTAPDKVENLVLNMTSKIDSVREMVLPSENRILLISSAVSSCITFNNLCSAPFNLELLCFRFRQVLPNFKQDILLDAVATAEAKEEGKDIRVLRRVNSPLSFVAALKDAETLTRKYVEIVDRSESATQYHGYYESEDKEGVRGTSILSYHTIGIQSGDEMGNVIVANLTEIPEDVQNRCNSLVRNIANIADDWTEIQTAPKDSLLKVQQSLIGENGPYLLQISVMGLLLIVFLVVYVDMDQEDGKALKFYGFLVIAMVLCVGAILVAIPFEVNPGISFLLIMCLFCGLGAQLFTSYHYRQTNARSAREAMIRGTKVRLRPNCSFEFQTVECQRNQLYVFGVPHIPGWSNTSRWNFWWSLHYSNGLFVDETKAKANQLRNQDPVMWRYRVAWLCGVKFPNGQQPSDETVIASFNQHFAELDDYRPSELCAMLGPEFLFSILFQCSDKESVLKLASLLNVQDQLKVLSNKNATLRDRKAARKSLFAQDVVYPTSSPRQASRQGAPDDEYVAAVGAQ